MVGRLINDVLVKLWIEAVTAKLKVLSCHVPEGAEEDHKISASFIQISTPELGLKQPNIK
jgi:hypothetical protein